MKKGFPRSHCIDRPCAGHSSEATLCLRVPSACSSRRAMRRGRCVRGDAQFGNDRMGHLWRSVLRSYKTASGKWNLHA
jgi:hypothetical protein